MLNQENLFQIYLITKIKEAIYMQNQILLKNLKQNQDNYYFYFHSNVQ